MTPKRSGTAAGRSWSIVRAAVKIFWRIDGTQWAGAFAFNAFFSLFPLIVFLVTLASFFIDQNVAGREVIAYLQRFVPMTGAMQDRIIVAIAGVIEARERAGGLAFVILVWSGMQCFFTLLNATNQAWGRTGYTWWRIPFMSLVLLGATVVAILLGMALPMLMNAAEGILANVYHVPAWLNQLSRVIVPSAIMFGGLTMFFMLAPRQRARWSQVWLASLVTTVLLALAQYLFVLYFRHFASLNELYGTFGGIMALLMWIYLSGCVLIFGASLCAARADVNGEI